MNYKMEAQITVDDEPFLIQQDQVDNSLSVIRDVLNKKSLTSICLDCGDEIGSQRLKIVPSATLCIDCQIYKDSKK